MRTRPRAKRRTINSEPGIQRVTTTDRLIAQAGGKGYDRQGLAGRRTAVFFDGRWHDGETPLIAPSAIGFWLGATVFDGARYFEGVAPDLKAHCARAIRSAEILGMAPPVDVETMLALAREGIRKFPADTALYVKPVFFAESGFIAPEPESTRFLLQVTESPMPAPTGFTACLSRFRRPAKDMAPTEAKASCLYPNVARCLSEARTQGFDTAIVLDPSGNLAEFAYTNLFIVRDGTVQTPAANGTFLNGITRQRVIGLLRADGVPVEETSLSVEDAMTADEIFATGNYQKIGPCTRLLDKRLEPGPVYRRARALYWDFARSETL